MTVSELIEQSKVFDMGWGWSVSVGGPCAGRDEKGSDGHYPRRGFSDGLKKAIYHDKYSSDVASDASWPPPGHSGLAYQ